MLELVRTWTPTPYPAADYIQRETEELLPRHLKPVHGYFSTSEIVIGSSKIR